MSTSPCFVQDAGSQQVGFLLGSCGVTLALTTDACQKGLPKAQTGEVAAFKGRPPRARESACNAQVSFHGGQTLCGLRSL